MLFTVLVLAATLAVLLAAASGTLSTIVDRRWPADEPMSPAELLWGEIGGHVQKTFPGLDPDIALDLTPYLQRRTIGSGQVIVMAGSPATDYFVLTKGEAVTDSGEIIAVGDGIGSDEIRGGGAHRTSVTATKDCSVIALPAEDYLAAVVLGAGSIDAPDPDAAILDQMTAGMVDPTPQPAPSAPQVLVEEQVVRAADTGSATTGDVVAGTIVRDSLPGFVLPRGDAPTATLDAGTAITVVEEIPGWVHVRTDDGWQGWVERTGVQTTN